MDRYFFRVDGDRLHWDLSEHGEWVKYEDVQEEIEFRMSVERCLNEFGNIKRLLETGADVKR